MKHSLSGVLFLCLLLWRADRGLALPPPDAAAPASWIAWDHSTERIVSAPTDTGAAYPRARQLSNGEILLAYHHGEGVGDYGAWVTLRKSRDGGATWYQTQEVDGPKERGFWGFCNPDFIELGGGRVMLVSAARGKPDPYSRDPFFSEGRHSGLRVRFSNNYGSSWGPPHLIVPGRGRVWEPSIVRLPGGELEIFYANESPDLEVDGSRQCIESIRSSDEGQSWSKPIVVSEDPQCRNGMPAALTLNNGHVICAQEVVGLKGSPWIADTLHGRTDGYRLAQDRYDFGAAPFLIRAPDGSTLMVFHSQFLQGQGFKQVPMSWLFSQIYVQHGDADAKNFGPASCPWPSPEAGTGAFFPSLMMLNDGTLVALSSFITVHPDHSASTVVRWIKGRLLTGPERSLLGKAGSGAVPPRKEKPSGLPARTEQAAVPLAHDSSAEYKYGPPPDDGTSRSGAGY